jgi:hypothetical protein
VPVVRCWPVLGSTSVGSRNAQTWSVAQGSRGGLTGRAGLRGVTCARFGRLNSGVTPCTTSALRPVLKLNGPRSRTRACLTPVHSVTLSSGHAISELRRDQHVWHHHARHSRRSKFEAPICRARLMAEYKGCLQCCSQSVTMPEYVVRSSGAVVGQRVPITSAREVLHQFLALSDASSQGFPPTAQWLAICAYCCPAGRPSTRQASRLPGPRPLGVQG